MENTLVALRSTKVKNKIGVSIESISNFVLALCIYLFSYRGNFGALSGILFISLKLLFSRPTFSKKSKITNLWALFLIIFSILLYSIRTAHFQFYVFTAYLLSVFILLFFDQKNLNKFLRILFWISVFVLISVFIELVFPTAFNVLARFFFTSNLFDSIGKRNSSGYITGITSEVSYSTLFLVFGFLYSVFISRKNFKGFIALFFILGLLATGKKAPPIFLFLSMIATSPFVIINKEKRAKIWLFSFISIILVVILYPIWSKFSSLSRVNEFLVDLFSGSDINSLSSGRVVIYDRAVELWETNKFYGIGWLNFRFFGAYGDSIYTTWFANFDVHNCYLQILCETGIFGFTVFGVLLLMTIKKVITNKNIKYDGVSKLFFVYSFYFLLYAFTEPVLFSDSHFILLFIGLTYLLKK